MRRSARLILALWGLLWILLAYQVWIPFTLDLGRPDDRLFLASAALSVRVAPPDAFHGDERNERFTYRWTQARSTLTLPRLGPFPGGRVVLWLHPGIRPEGSPPARIELEANGVRLGGRTLEEGLQPYAFDLPPVAAADLRLTLVSPTFSPGGGDPRQLGVIVDRVRIAPKGLLDPTWPGLPALAWGLALLLGLAAWDRRLAWAGAPLWGLALALARPWAAALTPPLALLAWGFWGLAVPGPGLIRTLSAWVREVWRPDRARWAWALVALLTVLHLLYWTVLRPRFWRPPWSAERILTGAWILAFLLYLWLFHPRRLRALLAPLAGADLWGALAAGLWAGGLLWVLVHTPFVGHADYADNAVVARNLLAGRGFVVDYVAQFYHRHPGITHPQETWPLLQPVWIALSYRLLGITPLAARLPNLLFGLALAGLLARIGRRLGGAWAGTLALILTLYNPLIVNLVVYATNDLAFVLFLTTATWAAWRAEVEEGGRVRAWAVAGIWAGLAMLQKPSGAIPLAGVGLWWLWRRRRELLARRWGILRGPLAFVGTASLLLAPLFAYNLRHFGRPFFSTESYDAWILKYRPWEEIYTLFWTRPLPHPRLLVGYGFDRVTGAVLQELRKVWGYVRHGKLWSSALLPLLGAGLLWIWGTLPPSPFSPGGSSGRRQRNLREKRAPRGGKGRALGRGSARSAPWPSLLGLLTLQWGLYTAFLVTYWHAEERYYLPLIPWGTLLVGALLSWVLRILADGGRRPRLALLGGALVLALLAGVLAEYRTPIQDKLRFEVERRPGQMAVYRWMAANLPADAVVMARNPWQMHYYTGRKGVMIPNGSLEEILTAARFYGVDVLLLEGERRPALAPLQRGEARWGFELLYQDAHARLYAVPQEGDR